MIGDKLYVVVCVKYTVSAAGQSAPRPGAQGVPMALSPFDEYAVEEGVRIKERLGGAAVVTSLTLGAPNASEGLRDCIARGSDDGVLLSSPLFDRGDTYATSYVLSQALAKLSKERGPVDLVLCGKNTNDSDTGQVGPSLAAHLGVPGIVGVKKVAEVQPGSPGRLVVHRMVEDGTEVIESSLPCVVAITKEINEPRIPALKGKMAAKKAVLPTWGPAELGAEESRTGSAGSLLSWGEPQPVPSRGGGEVLNGTDAGEKVRKLVARLKERGLL